MKNRVIFLSLSILLATTQAFARDHKSSVLSAELSCKGIIKQCFAFVASKRSNCFQSASENYSCSSSEFRDLINLRAGIRAEDTSSETISLSPSTAVILNHSCVESFDSQFSSALLQDKIAPQEIDKLKDHLEGCVETSPDKIY